MKDGRSAVRPTGHPSLSGRGESPIVHVRLERMTHRRVAELAERERVTPSEIVRRALAAYLPP